MADVDPQLEAADNLETPERPEWLPENFNSPEDMARSYAEAQRKITELAQEKKGLEESINLLSSQFEEFTAAQNRPDPNQVYAQWQDAFDADPIGTMARIAETAAQQVHQQYAQQQSSPSVSPDVVAFIADQQMGSTHEDWGSYKEKVGDLIAHDPIFQRDDLWSNPQTASQALDRAYQMVKAQDVLSGNDVVQQQAADTRAMKLAAQTAAGSSGRTPAMPDEVAAWERIKAAGNKPYWA